MKFRSKTSLQKLFQNEEFLNTIKLTAGDYFKTVGNSIRALAKKARQKDSSMTTEKRAQKTSTNHNEKITTALALTFVVIQVTIQRTPTHTKHIKHLSSPILYPK